MYTVIGIILNVPKIFVIKGILIPTTINKVCFEKKPDDLLVVLII